MNLSINPEFRRGGLGIKPMRKQIGNAKVFSAASRENIILSWEKVQNKNNYLQFNGNIPCNYICI